MSLQNESFLFDENNTEEILKNTLTKYMNQLSKKEKADMMDVYSSFPETRNFRFVNFNYTDTLEQVVNQIDGNTSIATSSVSGRRYDNFLRNIIYVHRKLNNGMFLGVNDETQMNSEIFSDIEKSFLIKPSANEAFRDNTNEEVEDVINESNIIIIYGMSLGETDEKCWKLICKWLEKKTENRLIIYVHDETFLQSNPLFYLQKRRDFEDLFIEYSYDLNDEEAQEKISELREKIYLISNSESDFNFSLSVDRQQEYKLI